MKLTIFHNPQCSKSRATLALLREQGHQPEIIEYLKDPPSPERLDELLHQLGKEPGEILRTQETAYAEYERSGAGGQDLSRSALLSLMSRHPALIQRPIVTNGTHAVLGRPPENVLQLLHNPSL